MLSNKLNPAATGLTYSPEYQAPWSIRITRASASTEHQALQTASAHMSVRAALNVRARLTAG
ncbi:hypothetical protein [Anaerobiospirillum sp. NML120449]|uniref:hypothetical protein n=1 Tax=Anaerobiospirillum sp. NML120449 TaxID=2932817 RepID=UPI001FF2EEF2|nr:hypothetical protein [Anaerobiospirillum sp. NML120449]MCK0526384.1 hypothetical protein [Anaerobiospirillum sp. NML120449]